MSVIIIKEFYISRD